MIRGLRGLQHWGFCLSTPALTRPCRRTFSNTSRSHDLARWMRNEPQLDDNVGERYQPQYAMRSAPRRALVSLGIGVGGIFDLRLLRISSPATKLFAIRIFYARRHVVHHFQHRYLEAKGNPMGPFYSKLYQRKHAKPLWWKCSVEDFNSGANLRSKCKGRVQLAFRKALEKHGYDDTGRKVPRPDGKEPADDEIVQLYGTAYFKNHNAKFFWKASFEDLLVWMEDVVKLLEVEIGQTKDGTPHRDATPEREFKSAKTQESRLELEESSLLL